MANGGEAPRAPSVPQPPPARVKLQSILTDNPNEGWETAWKADMSYLWDFGEIQPPLRDLLTSGEVPFVKEGGRALVPGCGRGYDAVAIASILGNDTLAMDISATGIQAGKDYLASLPPLSLGKVTFLEGDFFTYEVSAEERFDLIYDFTFFVAIQPSRRNEWGQKVRSLIKPGGYLVTIVYPIIPHTTTGPPFFLRPEHYLEPLGDGWEKIVDKVPEASLESHVGQERIVVWKRL
ncbi:hypothetical protein ONZ45_g1234 [Pleurotus djamor]|nr:hypothetical protein ONZ45_g1234 [Pleurotus djamor]